MRFEEKEYESAIDEQFDVDLFKARLTDAAKSIAPVPKSVVIYALLEKAAEIAFSMDDGGLFIEAAEEVYSMALSGDARILGDADAV